MKVSDYAISGALPAPPDPDCPDCGAPMNEDEQAYGACYDCAYQDHLERQADIYREEHGRC